MLSVEKYLEGWLDARKPTLKSSTYQGYRSIVDGQALRIWATALKRAIVRYRRPYQMRHTFASMMLSAGEHPMWVAQQMGHKDWATFIRVYGKWMPTADPDAGGKAVDLFGESRH